MQHRGPQIGPNKSYVSINNDSQHRMRQATWPKPKAVTVHRFFPSQLLSSNTYVTAKTRKSTIFPRYFLLFSTFRNHTKHVAMTQVFPFSLFLQRHLQVPSVSSPTNPCCHVPPTFFLATLLRAVIIDRHQCLASSSVPHLYKSPTSMCFVVSMVTTTPPLRNTEKLFLFYVRLCILLSGKEKKMEAPMLPLGRTSSIEREPRTLNIHQIQSARVTHASFISFNLFFCHVLNRI